MKLIYSKEFNLKPSSVNRAYGIGRNKLTGKSFIVKNKKYEDSFKEIELEFFINSSKILSKINLKEECFFIEYTEIMSDFFTKKGTINLKRGDSDRYLKGIKDAVFKGIGENDGYCIGEKTLQLNGKQSKIEVKIYSLKQGE